MGLDQLSTAATISNGLQEVACGYLTEKKKASGQKEVGYGEADRFSKETEAG